MRRRTRLRATLLRGGAVAATLLGAFVLSVATQAAARADTPWGSTGATYRSGIVCALPDGRRVALASWVVGGATAFSTADVVARGSSYGAAPRTAATRDLATGTRGLSAADLAGLAYLIGHAGAGTPTQVAGTSALVARAFGSGSAQQQCLGQQGTSAAAASALSLTARRFAGPYTVRADAVRAKPGSTVPVTATVLSAIGAPTPGIPVSFDAGAGTATGVTGADGRASVRLAVPADVVATTQLSATVSQPVGLRLVASKPAAVTLGVPRPAVGRAPVEAVLHPAPQLSVTGGSALVLAGGSLTPTAGVAGTYGYSGTGTVAVVGPVAAPTGGCSLATYGNAPTVWNGTFNFAGDGARPVGSTGSLRPGCYAFTGRLITTDSSPAVTATAQLDPARASGVSALQITQAVGSGLARAGALGATVSATGATGATVTSTLATYGPLPAASGGHCDTGLTWAGAKTFARSAPVALTARGNGRSSAVVRTPSVTAIGCYAVVARSTVTQDGRSAVVAATPGAAGTTVMVIAPALRVTNSAYDGRQGTPMAGTVHVTGTLGLAGSVAIALASAPAPAEGCHALTFPTTTEAAGSPGGSTTVATNGDGDYRFRSPVPSRNRCYAVVATLAMAEDSAVQVAAAPSATAVFLAGAVPPAPHRFTEHDVATAAPTRELAVFGATGGVVLVVALGLMIAAAVAGDRKPDPRAGELLVEFSSSA